MPVNPLQIPNFQSQGPIDWTPLSQLGQTYKAAQNERKLSDLGKGLADGSIDYRQAAAQAADMGDIGSLYKFLTLDEAKKKQALESQAGRDFATSIAPYFGGSNAPPAVPGNRPPMAAPASIAPDSIPAPQPLGTRAPVASSATTWGDNEAVTAGLYESKPGQSVPGQPKPYNLASLGANMPAPSGPSVTTNGMAGQGSPMAPAPSPRQAAAIAANTAPQVVPQNDEPTGMRLPPASVLIGGMMNPNMPTAQREFAGQLFKRVLDDAKPDEKVKHLQELARVSGFQGTPLELEMQLRRAGKTDVTTNIDQKGETEEAKAAGKGAGERRATMFASAGAASKTLINLSRTESLLNQVSQGRLEPGRMSISAWAKALGVNDDVAKGLGLDPQGVGSAQALQSLVNESVIGKIGSGGFPANNFSDADREFITGIFPRLGDDPAANKIRIEGARRIAQLDIQRAKDYQSYKTDPRNKGKGFEDFELDWSDKIAKQDIFGDLRKQAETISGPARTDIGGTLNNPGAAPSQRPRQPQGGWQDIGGGVRIRERR